VAVLALWTARVVTADEPERREVTEADLKLVRHLKALWMPVESGAPALVFDLSVISDEEAPPPAGGEARRAARAVEVLLDLGRLSPGRYEFDNPLEGTRFNDGPYLTQGRIARRGRTIRIDVTDEHLKLLRRARFAMEDGGGHAAVFMDAKRPYGDMTSYSIDMAEALGVAAEGEALPEGGRAFSPEQERRFDRLHAEMQPVLQVFVLQAALAAGRFVRDPGDGRWKRETAPP
jgi:hypothetical protein